MNAKAEFLEAFGGLKVIAADIIYTPPYKKRVEIPYKNGNDFEEFLAKLDFEYDNSFGWQELHGTVWFDCGLWAERSEYDGSEWWAIIKMPEIPENLK